jgi:hypothetical protein
MQRRRPLAETHRGKAAVRVRCDVGRTLTISLRALRVPVMALQTTYCNNRRECRSMPRDQTTLEMLRNCMPSVRIKIIAVCKT